MKPPAARRLSRRLFSVAIYAIGISLGAASLGDHRVALLAAALAALTGCTALAILFRPENDR